METREYVGTEIRGKLRRLKGLLRARLCGEGVLWALSVLVVAVFFSLAVDYVLRLDRPLRAAISVAALLAVALVAWRELLRPLLVPMDSPDLALLVERRFGQLDDRLIAAIQFSQQGSLAPLGMSDTLVAAMAREANELARSLDFRDVVDFRSFRQTALIASLAVVSLGGFTAWQYPTMQLWFQRNVALANVDWPQETYLQVLGGPDFKILRGEDLTITVVARDGSVVPPHVTFHARYPSLAGTTEDRIDPDAQGRFVLTVRNVSEEFSFWVTGGDDRLDRRRRHRVALVDAPGLADVRFRMEPPSYYRSRPPESDGSSGILSVGAGWWVHLRAVATKDLRHAVAILDSEESSAIGDAADRLRDLARELRGSREISSARWASAAQVLRRTQGKVEEVRAVLEGSPPAGSAFSLERIEAEGIGRLRTLVQAAESRSANVPGPRPGDEPATQPAATADRGTPSPERPATSRPAGSPPLDDIADVPSASDGELCDEIDRTAGVLDRMREWMHETPLEILPQGEDNAPRGVRGRVFLWGRNRSAALNLTIRMTDSEDITNRRGTQYVLNLAPDTAPSVEVRKNGVGGSVTPIAAVPLYVVVRDDHGLAECNLVGRRSEEQRVGSNEGAPTTAPSGAAVTQPVLPALAPGQAEIETQALLDLRERTELKLAPGDRVQVHVEARDVLPGELQGPNRGRSATLEFRVVSVQEMLEELIRRQKELRVEFAEAVDLQATTHSKSLAAADRASAGDTGAETSRLLAESSRIQTAVAAECGKAADTLAAILTEMRNNRVGNPADLDESWERVVAPLNAVVPRCRTVAAGLETLAAAPAAPAAVKLAAEQEALRREMETILSNMTRIGSRQEVAKELQRILDLSQKLKADIESYADEETGKEFDPKP